MTVPEHRGLNRRRLLKGGALGVAGAGGLALGFGLAPGHDAQPERTPSEPFGADTVPFHGVHQAGVETPVQASATYLGFDLHPDSATAGQLGRLLRLWTDDAVRLTAGFGALGDQEPELAAAPARLTVTVGLGPRIFAELLPGTAGAAPTLPAFETDALQDRWGQTDIVLQICGDNPTSLAHARRVLTRTARPFVTVVWRQDGFQQARGAHPTGSTPRNLLGQVDGTVNPQLGSEDFDRLVWITDGPLAGGTQMVVRRIAMQLDTWEQVGRAEREQVLGRTLGAGAPLTGQTEHDVPDLDARDENGSLVIPDSAHIRRAHHESPDERFLRRGYNYDDADSTGLLFVSYQADITRQFLPVQQRLASLDALNAWTQAIGSATYTVLPGCQPGQTLGQSLGLGLEP